MAKLNLPANRTSEKTYEGGTAKRINHEQALKRSVMACLLWENTFYEDGQEVGKRIADLVAKCKPQFVADLAVEAREKMKLRHVPLLLARTMASLSSHRHLVEDTLSKIIQRPDELTEYLAIYWKDGRKPVSAQSKKGLAKAFAKFNEYSLAKFNRDGQVKLRDVLRICHPKPIDEAQGDLWKRLIKNELAVPDTWEVALSGGKEPKKDIWERLLKENKLGALALIRNLRNMMEEKVSISLIREALKEMKVERVLPFRFIAASKYAPKFEPELESAMFKCLEGHEKLSGNTILLVDVSGSMDSKLSSRSDLNRIDAACGLAMLLREVTDNCDIITFSEKVVRVPARHGFALRDAIFNSQEHSGTYTGEAIRTVNKSEDYDRIIVISDEQSADNIPNPKEKGYFINVSTEKNGIGYGRWTHFDGFSEAVVSYIVNYEK